MEELYVIPNKSYHHHLLIAAFGENPLIGKFVETVAVWCPADPTQNEITSKDEIYKDNGYLKEKYVGRTTFIH